MEVRITGSNEEIADLIVRIQGQPVVNAAEVTKNMINEFTQTFAATRDSGAEYCEQKQQ